VPSAKQAAKDIISKEIVNEFGAWFNLNRPVYVSEADILPTVARLPGAPFHAASQAATQALFVQARDGRVPFPAGDYSVAVTTYCMKATAHGPYRNKFRLAPIKGAWADIVAALNWRAANRFNGTEVQFVSWSLQTGMNYGAMSPRSRQIVDAVLPDYKTRLQGDFLTQARQKWTEIASRVPGVPGFDAALNRLGEAGKAIEAIKSERDELIGHAGDYDRVVKDFSILGGSRERNALSITPWSIIEPGVYARLLIGGTMLTPGMVQIRVTSQAASTGMVASAELRELGNTQEALGFPGIPFTPWAGFNDPSSQPLSWTPQPGQNPGPPPLENSGPNPGQAPGGTGGSNPGQPPDNGGPDSGQGPGNSGGPNSGQNPSGNQEPPQASQPGGNNGGTSSGNNGANGSNGASQGNPTSDKDNGDASTPCDPPDNWFGVQKGKLLSDTSNSMSVDRGKGKGIVCLLLRPNIDLAALGWNNRFNGSVDSGSVSYNLPGHSGPGHVVVYAHYSYSTKTGLDPHLHISQPYVMQSAAKHVTAVIDYGNVTPFCTELAQTLALHGNPQSPNWLSGAELENRMCITGMVGQQVKIHTWVVDGDTVTASALTHPVDPSNFLYADAWGHM